MRSDAEILGEDDVRPQLQRPQWRLLEEHGAARPQGDGSHLCASSTSHNLESPGKDDPVKGCLC